MTPTARSLVIGGVLLAAGIAVVACDDVIEDATFRMWCGDTLCAWKLEAGSIRRAPTWHKQDKGVELVDTPTAISQVTTKTPRCLAFTVLADVDPSAQVTVGLDFHDDGTIDQEQLIAATHFHEAKTLVTAPFPYERLRVIISKKGVGHAVLAEMRVQASNDCTAPPIALHDLPLGTPCSLAGDGAECASGVCCDGLCSECCAGETAGQALPDGGTAYNRDEACADPAAACLRRNAPSLRPLGTMRFPFEGAVPLQCSPGERSRDAGAECLADDDCASAACAGASSIAEPYDAGGPSPSPSPSPSSPSPCAAAFPDAGACQYFTSVRGGRCR